MLKPISARHQLCRFYPLAEEKQLFTHLSKNQSDGEGWHGKNRRTSEDGSQNLGELQIRHWIRSDRVYRPGDRLVFQHMLNCTYDIADRDPGPPLPAVAKPAAEAHAERRKHFRQGAAVGAHHYSKAHL